ncbi:uncharacterized protein [Panulirus ornatus]|uniref:uncharacterized protein n=1 Tax=Panulirus ornatus TaxID=150431 RepID=UPI003A8802E6
MISTVIQGGKKGNLKMEIIVILALFTLVSTSHVRNPYVYETHDHYGVTQSSRPFMILSPPQSRPSFQTPQFSSNTPNVFRQTEQTLSRNTMPDFRTPHNTLPNVDTRHNTFPNVRTPHNTFPNVHTLHNTYPNIHARRNVFSHSDNFPHFQSSNIQPRPILSLPPPQPIQSLPSRQSRTSPLCHPSKHLVDETRNGQSYHLSWCHDGGASYSWEDAKLYCQMLGSGFRALSIEDQVEDDFISNIIHQHDIPWIWTSGNKIFTTYWVWHDGSTFAYTNWSPKGGSGIPQPDNRENNEKCMAVLNDFYQDGIKWHDIACHHEKHVICEAERFH